MEKTRLIVVKDFENRGKSTTLWLLLFTLVKQLKAEPLYLYNQNRDQEMKELPDTIPSGEDMFDVYAVVRWKMHIIVIISRGDYADLLLEDMKYALEGEPDFIVNAIHERERNHEIWNSYNNAYPNTHYKRICFWSENAIDPNNALIVKDPTVEAILKYMS